MKNSIQAQFRPLFTNKAQFNLLFPIQAQFRPLFVFTAHFNLFGGSTIIVITDRGRLFAVLSSVISYSSLIYQEKTEGMGV